MPTLLAAATPSRSSLVVVTIAAVTAGCWVYLVIVYAATATMGSSWAMPMTVAWTAADAGLMWVMWAVMMVAMMLPSATPMITAYSRTLRSPRTSMRGSTVAFAGGYIALWASVAIVAAGLQWILHRAALVDAMGAATSRWVAAPVLVMAGAYQFTGLKHTMLSRCRSPLGFLLNQWRDGRLGGFVMGLHHGVLCLGCCWALMGLLFVLGVMNLLWIALLATTVLVEKVTRSDLAPRALGVVMIVGGLVVAVGV